MFFINRVTVSCAHNNYSILIGMHTAGEHMPMTLFSYPLPNIYIWYIYTYGILHHCPWDMLGYMLGIYL